MGKPPVIGGISPIQIWTMDNEGNNQTHLSYKTREYRNKFPSWSPDGQRVSYALGGGQLGYEIIVTDVEGNNIVNITNNEQHMMNLISSWSPDGQRIAFDSNRDGSWQIYTINVNSNNLKKLTNGSANNGNPAWSPY